jgi:hypothetical protein
LRDVDMLSAATQLRKNEGKAICHHIMMICVVCKIRVYVERSKVGEANKGRVLARSKGTIMQ